MNAKTLLAVAILGSFVPIPAAVAQDKNTRVVKQLADNGFQKCSASLDGIVRWIHNDDTYAHVTTWNQKTPNERTGFAATSQRLGDGSAMMTTFTASPDSSGKCTISASQVFTSKTSCSALRENVFAGWKFLLDMGSTAAYELENEKEVTAYLTPTPGGGCMILKQSIVYQ